MRPKRQSDAACVFLNLPHRNVVAWNAMILGYAKQADRALALDFYAKMHEEGFKASSRTFVSALKACTSLAALEEEKEAEWKFAKFFDKGRAIHSQVVKGGFDSHVFVGNSLLDMYAKYGSVEDAQSVFDQLSRRDVVSWNAMILMYSMQEGAVAVLNLYARMQQEGVTPDHQTFGRALMACSSLTALEQGKKVDGDPAQRACLEKGRALHSHVIYGGFESDISVGATLVDMYLKCGSRVDAQYVFDNLPRRKVVSWNAMIMCYSKQEEGTLALDLYACMEQEDVKPDHRTFVGILKACSFLATLEEGTQLDGNCVKIGCLVKGRSIHSQVIKHGFESNNFVGNTLVDFYTKCGSMDDAMCVFDGLPHRDVVSWNAMILGYSKQEDYPLALDLYARIKQESITPDHITFIGALRSCGTLGVMAEGKEVDRKFAKAGFMEKGRAIHSQLVQRGFESDVFVGTTLVDMYAKFWSVADARRVFDELGDRNVASWNAMILGYARQEEGALALELYAQMQKEDVQPSFLTFVGALKACGGTSALESGKELHFEISRVGLETVKIVANCLIDMYAKCGNMIDAQQLFDGLPERDVVTWSSLIAGYANQGESERVFKLFETMREEGIQPDSLTFLSVLTVCSHVGLLDKGQMYFQAMSKEYDMILTVEHYTCMVDLLGRAGKVDEAMVMVEKMPFQPNVVVLSTLLGACQKSNNVDVGRYAFEKMLRLDEKLPASYILMANIYADVQMQEVPD